MATGEMSKASAVRSSISRVSHFSSVGEVALSYLQPLKLCRKLKKIYIHFKFLFFFCISFCVFIRKFKNLCSNNVLTLNSVLNSEVSIWHYLLKSLAKGMALVFCIEIEGNNRVF